ncbi:glycine betaine ABC transporter substrate-binding protein [Arthrobacter sp. LAPM80]|uniref:glycine betaine ABC transporter substrate-binding protein n=1 Tax=Arthrobacter sp. LAPM80 TaxID=3141788 RepID=UPI00398AB078
MRRRVVAALAVAVLLMGTATACTPTPIATIPSASHAPGATVFEVGTPQVPDGVDPRYGALLANVYAAALNAAGAKALVTATPSAPGKLLSDVESGDADIVPVYSGLALSEVTGKDTASNASDTLAALKAALPAGLQLLDPTKAEDRAAIVVTAVTAEKYQLKSLADLGKVCNKLAMGGPAGFQTGTSGLAGLGSDYNCVPKKYVALEPTLDYSPTSTLWALLQDDIQVADVHSSSPGIEDNALVVLNDPKQLFPSQNIVPLVATDKVPAAVQDVINKVSAALNTDELANLNRLSRDLHFGSLSDVATAWLVQMGLVKASS